MGKFCDSDTVPLTVLLKRRKIQPQNLAGLTGARFVRPRREAHEIRALLAIPGNPKSESQN